MERIDFLDELFSGTPCRVMDVNGSSTGIDESTLPSLIEASPVGAMQSPRVAGSARPTSPLAPPATPPHTISLSPPPSHRQPFQQTPANIANQAPSQWARAKASVSAAPVRRDTRGATALGSRDGPQTSPASAADVGGVSEVEGRVEPKRVAPAATGNSLAPTGHPSLVSDRQLKESGATNGCAPVSALAENARLRETVRELSQQVAQLKAAASTAEDERSHTRMLLEECTAYMSELKNTVAQEQAARRAVEQRCEAMAASFTDTQSEMEVVQAELRRRFAATTEELSSARAEAQRAASLMAELERLRAVAASSAEEHAATVAALRSAREESRRMEDRRQKAEKERLAAEAAQAVASAQCAALTEERSIAEEQAAAARVGQKTAEAACAAARELVEVLRGCTRELLTWLEAREGEAGGVDGCTGDRLAGLEAALSVERVAELLPPLPDATCDPALDVAQVGAMSDASPVVGDVEAAVLGTAEARRAPSRALQSTTLGELLRFRERALAAAARWEQRQTQAHMDTEAAVYEAVAAATKSVELLWGAVETRVGGLARRLTGLEGAVAAALTPCRARTVTQAAQHAELQQTNEEAAGLRAAFAQSRMQCEDAQRVVRLLRAEVDGLHRQRAVMARELSLRDVFEGVVREVRELRRMTAIEVQSAVDDIMDRIAANKGRAAREIFVDPHPRDEEEAPLVGPSSCGVRCLGAGEDFTRVLANAALRTEAHVSLMQRTLTACAASPAALWSLPITDSAHRNGCLTRAAAAPLAVDLTLAHHCQTASLSPPPRSPAGVPHGPPARDGAAAASPARRSEGRERGRGPVTDPSLDAMSPRQRHIYTEMRRLIGRPSPPSLLHSPSPTAGPSAPLLHSPSPRASPWAALTMEGERARCAGLASSLGPEDVCAACPPASHCAALCSTAESLSQQLRNLAEVVAVSRSQSEEHVRAVVHAMEAWQHCIADALSQSGAAIEERVTARYRAARTVPEAPGTPAERQEKVYRPSSPPSPPLHRLPSGWDRGGRADVESMLRGGVWCATGGPPLRDPFLQEREGGLSGSRGADTARRPSPAPREGARAGTAVSARGSAGRSAEAAPPVSLVAALAGPCRGG